MIRIRHDKKLFLQGAFILSGAAFVSKLLGALWRIPLTNLIGSEGIGRYQMIYPVYCLLLTLSSVGIPSALSRLVAEGKAPMKAATKLFLSIGAGSALLMIVLAPLFSFLQGIPSLRYGYYALAPAVTLVSGIAILRGYFQGRRRMMPIGISQIIEQGVKIGLGLLVASRYPSDPVRAVTGILLAVTISEAVALLFLLLLPKGERTHPKEEMCARAVWRETFPVSLSAMILPFSAWIDGLILPRLLGENGVSLYGLLTGCALLLVNLPSSLASGIAGSLIPSLAKGENTHGSAFVLTAILSLPVTAVLIAFPALPMKLFSLSKGNEEILLALLPVVAPAAFLEAEISALSGCLTGMGRAKLSAAAIGVGSLVKLIAQCLLVPRFGIFGAGISVDLGFLVAFLMELRYSIVRPMRGRIHAPIGKETI